MSTTNKHTVDCDANPNMLDGYFEKVFEHKKGGKLNLDMSKVLLYLSPNRSKFKEYGRLWEKELRSMPVLNANVLDYLMAHPKLIPDSWKGEKENRDMSHCALYVYFWGTIYIDGGGHYNVRFLGWHWEEKKWIDSLVWLDAPPSSKSPAAILEG